jgi:hypothetical protein
MIHIPYNIVDAMEPLIGEYLPRICRTESDTALALAFNKVRNFATAGMYMDSEVDG